MALSCYPRFPVLKLSCFFQGGVPGDPLRAPGVLPRGLPGHAVPAVPGRPQVLAQGAHRGVQVRRVREAMQKQVNQYGAREEHLKLLS